MTLNNDQQDLFEQSETDAWPDKQTEANRHTKTEPEPDTPTYRVKCHSCGFEQRRTDELDAVYLRDSHGCDESHVDIQEIVTDGGTDDGTDDRRRLRDIDCTDVFFVSAYDGKSKKRVHLDADCKYLKKATSNIRGPIKSDKLFDHWPLCTYCDPEVSRDVGKPVGDQYAYRLRHGDLKDVTGVGE